MAYNRLLERVELFYKMAAYGNRGKFLNSMAQTQTLPEETIVGHPAANEQEEIELPEQTIVGQPPKAGTPPTQYLPEQKIVGEYAPISTEVQDHLNQLLVPGGAIAPLKLDGKFGPDTQKAMQTFKGKYNLPATPDNNKSVLMKEKHPELATKAPF